ncbi:MAG: HEAT repeat domain-containing protein [Bryobacteraceae bacterium]|nr:HEAT repeat domain-containing protein [Bryobacteraceae bacterium]
MQQASQPVPAAKPKPRPRPTPPAEFQEKDIATMDAAALARLLGDAGSSDFQKAKACMRAGELGSKETVPALAALLADEKLSTYARYGLEPIADPSAGDALRAALPKLKGNLLIGVVNSLGKRRDEKAAPTLTKMMSAPDQDLARAAIAALGSIGTPAAMKVLQGALPKAAPPLKMPLADAALICAERLLADGNRDQALALYTYLSAPAVPKPARLGAMAAIIREETPITATRPR